MKKEGLEVEKPNVHKFKDPKDRLLKEPADTEMKDVEKATDEDETKKDVDLLTLEGIYHQVALLNIIVSFFKLIIKFIGASFLCLNRN